MGEERKIQRDILPIPDPKVVGLTTFDARDPSTKYPPIKTLRPPEGAPNVLIRHRPGVSRLRADRQQVHR